MQSRIEIGARREQGSKALERRDRVLPLLPHCEDARGHGRGGELLARRGASLAGGAPPQGLPLHFGLDLVFEIFDRRLAMIDFACRTIRMLGLFRGRYESVLAQVRHIGGREQPPLVQIFDDIGDDLHEPECAPESE